jgi:hypothetical protein
MQAEDLVGCWQLTSYRQVDSAGRTHGPEIGPDPEGVLFYSPDGHMAVSMVPTGARERFPQWSQNYNQYAGTWTFHGDHVVHHIEVAQDPEWVGTDQPRGCELAGDILTLSDRPDTSRPMRRVITWTRLRAVH